MLLFIAFLCFAALFAAWILAPTSAPSAPATSPSSQNVQSPGTQPA